jgi:hypothetical protein
MSIPCTHPPQSSALRTMAYQDVGAREVGAEQQQVQTAPSGGNGHGHGHGHRHACGYGWRDEVGRGAC